MNSGSVQVQISSKPEMNGAAPKKSLSDLIADKLFRRSTEYSYYREYGATVFTLEERKNIALRLFLGLLLSIDLDYTINVSNTEHVFFPVWKNAGRESPYVLCRLSSAEGCLKVRSAKHLDINGLAGVLAKMARILTELAIGETWNNIVPPPQGEEELEEPDPFEIMDKVEGFVLKEAGINTEPLLEAARACLSFDAKFHQRVQLSKSRPQRKGDRSRPADDITIAKQLVYDDILRTLDRSLPQTFKFIPHGLPRKISVVQNHELVIADGGFSAPRHAGLPPTECPSSIGSLFHIEIAKESKKDIKSAEDFFEDLSKFQESLQKLMISEPQKRIRIAILDTGIDRKHPEFALIESRRLMGYYSWIGDPDDWRDDDKESHGTHCAYLVHKAAPEADIYVARVFSENKMKMYEAKHVSEAIRHAVKTWEVDIISMSFGLHRPSSRENMQEYVEIVENIEMAIEEASKKLVFAAASNGGKGSQRMFPATLRDLGVFCIHASNGLGRDDDINPKAVPGDGFMTLGVAVEFMEGQMCTYKSGTSFATPIAAAMAANILHFAAGCGSLLAERTKMQLKKPRGMRTMFELMSAGVGEDYHFVAPWNLWKQNWQSSEHEERLILWPPKEMLGRRGIFIGCIIQVPH